MNLHEYQTKQLLTGFGLPCPRSEVATDPDQARRIAQQLGAPRLVVKAQIHAGGRGKAGGIASAGNADEVEAIATRLLGKRLVTPQTGSEGLPVNAVLVEEACAIERELFLGALIDRDSKRLSLLACGDGGVDIESVATNTPEKILRVNIHPVPGLLPYQCRAMGYKLGLDAAQLKRFSVIAAALVKAFIACDAALVEINPLVLTAGGTLVCLDAKLVIDDNALYRQTDIASLRDTSQEPAAEVRARKYDLNYVALDGNIGCMVNGAGLAMATMDMVQRCGGKPANFLDVGGGTTTERVFEAFNLVLSDPRVKGALVNIFGGIVRCDLIAEGIVRAIKQAGVVVPVVVRLEGNNAQQGLALLKAAGPNITTAQSFEEAAQRIVAAVA
ncbi:MAG: ADP-forming succinate--CoA ligase subunit beta [Burkholderiales bacterium]